MRLKQKVYRYVIYVILIASGSALGSLVTWYNSYSTKEITSDYVQDFERLLLKSDTIIIDENMSCENWFDNKISSVLSDLIYQNMFNNRNMTTFSCIDNVCYFSLSYCKPWQSQECSTVFLKYEIESNRDIIEDSVMCIVAP